MRRLITEIDPPREVDRALSAINSTRNQVAADISTARADAEQQITMSARAVEIAIQQRPGGGRPAQRTRRHACRRSRPRAVRNVCEPTFATCECPCIDVPVESFNRNPAAQLSGRESIMLIIPAFIAGLLAIPILLGLARFFGLYACVQECEAQVFTLFGKVIGTLDEAGLQFPSRISGPRRC